ncbi:MAG: hypothetical protein IT459_06720 [Planctomycetes bacterium]|nr:hypothetical protein [Planctomycetota bacterium]
MSRKIPSDAFERYLALGVERSYEALAAQLGCTRRAVTKRAATEKWQERLREVERKARDRTDADLIDSRVEAGKRHLKLARFLQSKGVEVLSRSPIETPADAIRAIALGIDKERLILGEPTERSETSIEEITKREIATLLEIVEVPDDDGEEDDDEADDEGQQVRAV